MVKKHLLIHFDCRHFRGDLPCVWHKEKGYVCESCPQFDPVGCRILIVKLDSLGDVLRSTAILRPLKAKYPGSHISWVTRSEARPLFAQNSFVDKVIDCDSLGLEEVRQSRYDVVINLDVTVPAALFASAASARFRFGFAYHPDGYATPLSPEADAWFNMGQRDNLKRSNRKTYQQHILEIARLDTDNHSLEYNLSAAEKDFKADFAAANGIGSKDLVVGLNTGAGLRWPLKIWGEAQFVELIKLLNDSIPGCRILLYGGPTEEEKHRRMVKATKGLALSTGCFNDLRSFGALLDLARVVVTGDTLAMHLAVALKKRVAVILGPTPAAEIELYGRGIKIFADLSCLACYATACAKKPNCMDLISANEVLGAVRQLLD